MQLEKWLPLVTQEIEPLSSSDINPALKCDKTPDCSNGDRVPARSIFMFLRV